MAQVTSTASCVADGRFKITAYFDASESATSVADNTSTISWHLVVKGTGTAGLRFSGSTRRHAGVCIAGINGTAVFNGYTGLPNGFTNGTVLIDKSGTVKVGHNNDGTKSCVFDVNLDGSDDDYGKVNWKFGDGPFSQKTLTLTTIPRAASIDSFTVNGDAYGTMSVKYTVKAANVFTYKLRISIPNIKSLMTIDYNTSNATFSLDRDAVSYVDSNYKTSTSVTLGAVIETYKGNTKIGESSELTKSVSIGSVPSISNLSVTEAVSGLASKFGAYIQNHSQVNFVITAAATHGATIKNCSVNFNGKTYTGTTVTSDLITNSGTISYQVTITDTRNRTASKSGSITVLAYEKPTVNGTAYRADSSYNRDDSNGTYGKITYTFHVTSLNGKNDKSFTIDYKKSTDSNWTSIMTDTANYSASEKEYDGSTAYFSDLTAKYNVRFTVSDYFTSATYQVEVLPTFALINFGKGGKSIAVGGQSSDDGYFEVFMGMRFRTAKGHTVTIQQIIDALGLDK